MHIHYVYSFLVGFSSQFKRLLEALTMEIVVWKIMYGLMALLKWYKCLPSKCKDLSLNPSTAKKLSMARKNCLICTYSFIFQREDSCWDCWAGSENENWRGAYTRRKWDSLGWGAWVWRTIVKGVKDFWGERKASVHIDSRVRERAEIFKWDFIKSELWLCNIKPLPVDLWNFRGCMEGVDFYWEDVSARHSLNSRPGARAMAVPRKPDTPQWYWPIKQCDALLLRSSEQFLTYKKTLWNRLSFVSRQ
jgi:hypothetical protein